MRAAGLVVGRTLSGCARPVAPGVTTARARRARRGVDPRRPARVPSFLGLPRLPGRRSAPRSTTRSSTASPATGCSARATSSRIDCGAILDGWHGDAAVTVPVGECPPSCSSCSRVSEEALWAGLAAVAPRRPALRHRRTPSRAYVRPQAATASSRTTPATASAPRCTWRRTCPTSAAGPGRGPELVDGHGAGRRADGHPRAAGDAARSTTAGPSSPPTAGRPAHCEHTVAVTADGPWVLTALDGGAARLAGAARLRRPQRDRAPVCRRHRRRRLASDCARGVGVRR